MQICQIMKFVVQPQITDNLTTYQRRPTGVTMIGYGRSGNDQFSVISLGVQKQSRQWTATEYSGVVPGTLQCPLPQTATMVGRAINFGELIQVEQAVNLEIDHLTLAADAST